MHDPLTVVWEIKSPFWRTLGRDIHRAWRYHPPLVTIWHRDPGVGGDEDSCDWFSRRLTKANGWWPVDIDELHGLPSEARRAVEYVWFRWRHQLGRRRWWQSPRWHVHHWKIQIHAVQALKRWAFSRCSACGRRFTWGYAPVSHVWGSDGPQWFRSETNVFHCECSSVQLSGKKEAEA